MIYVELLILNMLCIYSLNHVFLEMGGRIKDYPLPLPGDAHYKVFCNCSDATWLLIGHP